MTARSAVNSEHAPRHRRVHTGRVKGYCGGGTGPGWAAAEAPGGRDTEVRVARSWLDGDGPLPGPLAATAAGLGITFGGKLIAKNKLTNTMSR